MRVRSIASMLVNSLLYLEAAPTAGRTVERKGSPGAPVYFAWRCQGLQKKAELMHAANVMIYRGVTPAQHIY